MGELSVQMLHPLSGSVRDLPEIHGETEIVSIRPEGLQKKKFDTLLLHQEKSITDFVQR
jgi:hypothetical protein